ncbi:MAG: hypothetical protein ACI4CS_11020 [Candidatus Weimeria sp.]
MIIKITEWLGMQLLAIALVRFLVFVTNTDDETVWDKTKEAEECVMKRLLRITNIR